jgi:hypothetical protein
MPQQPVSLAFHPLFYYLHFSAGVEFDPTAVLHTLLPTHPDCRRKLYAPLCGHASAACAFATSPPVHAITLRHPDSECIIASARNPDGCTMLDVNRLLGDLCVTLYSICQLSSHSLTSDRGHNLRRLPRSLTNMRTVLSHYQTLLDDYRFPSRPFTEIMCSAPHRGFLEDHRSVVPRCCGAFFPQTFDRYPYLDLSPEDIERWDAPNVSMGPFIIRCERDDNEFRVHTDALFGVLSQK